MMVLQTTDTPTVSVVIPAYNVEEFLPRCLESLLQQTYHNIEIIPVDDGSPDTCQHIIKQFAEKDPRVKPIFQANAGLSAARNAGIDQASGQYLCFVDGDDWVAPDYIQILLEQAQSSGADVTICECWLDHENGDSEPHRFKKMVGVIDNQAAAWGLFGKDYLLMTVAWNKLYRAELFSNIRYRVGMNHEDEELIAKILWLCAKVCVITEPLYHYRQRPNSIMTSPFSWKKVDGVQAYESRFRFFALNGETKLAKATSLWGVVLVADLCGQALKSKLSKKSPEFQDLIKRGKKFNITASAENMPARWHAALWAWRISPQLLMTALSWKSTVEKSANLKRRGQVKT